MFLISLRKNILANYVSHFYVAVIGIVMVPMYVQHMGLEAFGLVGFYAMLQAWFHLLDMGLTPTVARESARFRGGAIDALNLRRLVRALESIVLVVAVLAATAMMTLAGTIAGSWLNVQQLPTEEVQYSIMLMAAIVALRWVSGLYRGVFVGFERLVWLSGFNIVVSTVRFVLVVPYLIYVGTGPVDFFTYQLAVAVIENVVLVMQSYCLLPRAEAGSRISWQLQPLRPVLRFALTIAFTSSLWTVVTQTDKLVLSKLLSLTEYSYFSLAVLMASGVMLVSGPISGALLPRLTTLSAVNDEAGLICLYRDATQMVSVIVIPVALVLGFFAEQVLWAWTGNAEIARDAAPVLTLYAIGNGILALSAFPYYLQFSKGNLDLHLIGSALFILLLVPALIWATWKHGVTGAGYAWLGANVAYFLAWVPKVHKKFADGLHTQWVLHDVGPILLPTLAAAALMHGLVSWPQDRVALLAGISGASLALIALAAAGSSWVRNQVNAKWRSRIAGCG